jgi:hypothetical protein
MSISSRLRRLVAPATLPPAQDLATEPQATTILVIGDAHFEPGQPLDRARLLGRIIASMQPTDHVVCMGDWHGMTTACRHISALEKEGGRIKADLDAGNDAITAMMQAAGSGPLPHLHVVLGNHDWRIDQLAANSPEYEGLVGSHLYDWERWGWSVSPFLEPLRVEGWRFQHFLPNKMGRAIGGLNLARKLLLAVRHSESIVVGHSHILDAHTEATVVAGRQWGLVAGCFFEHSEHYAGPDGNADWWRGLVFLRAARAGDAAIEAVPMAELYRRWPG